LKPNNFKRKIKTQKPSTAVKKKEENKELEERKVTETKIITDF
jgi:hypothetical protein